jgi:hypothetical protein
MAQMDGMRVPPGNSHATAPAPQPVLTLRSQLASFAQRK